MTYLKKCEGGTICWQNNASNRNLLLFTSITAKYYMNYKMLPIYVYADIYIYIKQGQNDFC